MGWGQGREGRGKGCLTESCAGTLDSGTQPHPTSCHRALAHSASGISYTGTPAGVEKGTGSLSKESSGSLIIGHSGNIYTMEIGKHYKSGVPPMLQVLVLKHVPPSHQWSAGPEVRFGVVVLGSGLISEVAVKLWSQSQALG